MTEQMEGQNTWFDQDTWFLKTYQDSSAPPVEKTEEKTSKPSSRKSSASQNQTLPMCLCLKKASGASQDASTMIWVDGLLLGDYTMHSFGESPREENVSLLSQILEDEVQPKYSLSEKACRGILRRADKRGKELPAVLREALENQIENELHTEN